MCEEYRTAASYERVLLVFLFSERIRRGKENHELHMCERNTVLTTNQVRGRLKTAKKNFKFAVRSVTT